MSSVDNNIREWEEYHKKSMKLHKNLNLFLTNYINGKIKSDFEQKLSKKSNFTIKKYKSLIYKKKSRHFEDEFYKLFEPIILNQSDKDETIETSNILWIGILEIDKTEQNTNSGSQPLKYSLFCNDDLVKYPKSFFDSHRLFEELREDEIFGITSYFRENEQDNKPIFIVSEDNIEAKLFSAGSMCRILKNYKNPDDLKKFLNNLKIPEEQISKIITNQKMQCCSCNVNEEYYDSSLFSCEYAPYSLSEGIILSNQFISSVDGACKNFFESKFMPIKKTTLITVNRIRDIFKYVFEECQGVINENNILLEFHSKDETLISKKKEKFYDSESGNYHRNFINYLIWLRLCSIFTDKDNIKLFEYFYFPIREITGGFFHGITIASSTSINKSLFYLVYKDSYKLFQRSILKGINIAKKIGQSIELRKKDFEVLQKEFHRLFSKQNKEAKSLMFMNLENLKKIYLSHRWTEYNKAANKEAIMILNDFQKIKASDDVDFPLKDRVSLNMRATDFDTLKDYLIGRRVVFGLTKRFKKLVIVRDFVVGNNSDASRAIKNPDNYFRNFLNRLGLQSRWIKSSNYDNWKPLMKEENEFINNLQITN